MPVNPSDSRRSRRALLAGALGGVGAWALAAFGRRTPARAAAGDPIRMGKLNAASGTNTTLRTSTSGTAFKSIQNGTGTALRGESADGNGGYLLTKRSGKNGLVVRNDGAAEGGGAALRAMGSEQHAIVAITDNGNRSGMQAINNASGPAVSASSAGGSAVYATTTGTGSAVFATVQNGTGVRGQASGGTGLYGIAVAGIGVRGESDLSNGVRGTSTNGFGVYAASDNNFAGYFDGSVHVQDDLEVLGDLDVAGTKSFRVDHPSDPANRYLYHYCTEGAEPLTLYSGTVALDRRGSATVRLPEWFGALNADVRYQLTAIGQPAPNLHVARQATDGSFRIAGGPSRGEVCWQLTARRDDAYLRAHPTRVEVDKPAAERGTYLHPVEHGQAASAGLTRAGGRSPSD
jgi:hypothetical protein